MTQERPNIILVVMDAARADHLSCYGYHRPTTPHIDRIASEGVLYENAISAAVWTVPSHASLFTGLYPSGHGLRGRSLKLRQNVPTLADFLAKQGYDTAALTANALVGTATGLTRGFHEVRDVRNLIQGDDLARWQQKINGVYRRFYFGPRPHRETWYDNGAWRLNFDLYRWIERRVVGNKRPFFVFANYMEPHLRYHPPRAYRQRFLSPTYQQQWRQVNQNAWKYMSGEASMTDEDWSILTSLYDAELAYLDARIGQLYTFLAEKGILDDTILIITSDHGENLGEHNLMDHQYCVYDTLAKVPLSIRYPQRFTPGTRITSLVQTLDIFPSLANLLINEDNLSSLSLEGYNLLPEKLTARSFTITEYLAPQLHSFKRESLVFDSYFSRQLRAIRTKTHKYIWASDGNHELYDLISDPGETFNLVDKDRKTAVTLAQQLNDWVSQYPQQNEAEDSPLDDAIINRLEALGYI